MMEDLELAGLARMEGFPERGDRLIVAGRAVRTAKEALAEAEYELTWARDELVSYLHGASSLREKWQAEREAAQIKETAG